MGIIKSVIVAAIAVAVVEVRKQTVAVSVSGKECRLKEIVIMGMKMIAGFFERGIGREGVVITVVYNTAGGLIELICGIGYSVPVAAVG